ncbi:hypothetical protein IWW38_005766, partial [Coemansia aciculifera]
MADEHEQQQQQQQEQQPLDSNDETATEASVLPMLPPAEGARRRIGHGVSATENRRVQNRNAATRHRQRQKQRLSELTRREAILKQRVSELEVEIGMLRRGRAGLRLPERDPFTATILSMLNDVGNLRASLLRYASESQLLVDD